MAFFFRALFFLFYVDFLDFMIQPRAPSPITNRPGFEMASIGPMTVLVSMCLCVAALASVAAGSVASFGPYYASSCAPFNADAGAVFDIETVAT